ESATRRACLSPTQFVDRLPAVAESSRPARLLRLNALAHATRPSNLPRQRADPSRRSPESPCRRPKRVEKCDGCAPIHLLTPPSTRESRRPTVKAPPDQGRQSFSNYHSL